MKARLVGLVTAGVLAALLAGGPVAAKAPGKLTHPAAQTSAVGKIPRTAAGKPDFSGVWETLSEADYDLAAHAGRRDAPPGVGVIDAAAIPYLPKALEEKNQNFAARQKEDPRLKCWVLGVPRSVYYPEPFQIFQRDRDLTLVHQFGHQVRTIHTNGTLHPVGADSSFFLGNSRGHWEGDTLVVDVTQFNEETWLDRAGDFHSDGLHVVERWTFVDANTISYQATLDDAAVYSRPWTITVLLNRRRDKDIQLIEDYCFTLPYDPFYPHKDGK